MYYTAHVGGRVKYRGTNLWAAKTTAWAWSLWTPTTVMEWRETLGPGGYRQQIGFVVVFYRNGREWP